MNKKMSGLIKKIRADYRESTRDFSEKIGLSHSFISKLEAGDRKVSKKTLGTLIKKYPLYEKELLQAYAEQNLPENFDDTFQGMRQVEGVKEQLKIYNFISNSDGRVNFSNYKEMEFMLTKEVLEIVKNGFIFEVTGEMLLPFFSENDIIVFKKEELETWQELDSKLILIKLDEDYYLRKLYFEDGEPYLYAFNDRLYPKIQISKQKKVEYIGKLEMQLFRSVKNIKF